MKQRMKKLWREIGATGEPPMPAVADVKRRVNAALNEDPSERRLYMKQKVRLALVVAAAVLALSSVAVAVASHLDVLEAFFEGGTSAAERLVDAKPRTASDENYTLTVVSSVSDENDTYMLVQVEAKNPQAAETLMSDKFVDMDTFHIAPLKDGEYARAVKEGTTESMGVGWGMGEEGELRTDTIRVWSVDVRRPAPTDVIRIWLDVMGKEHAVDVPVAPAESIDLTIGAQGMGVPTLDNAQGGALRVESVTLSPFTCKVEISREKDEPLADSLILFRMEDGTLRGRGEMMTETSGYSTEKDGRAGFVTYYRFRQVQDLGKIRALVVFGKEYPLDGGAPTEVADDGALQPVRLPLQETLDPELGGYAIGVRGLCDALGASCQWDAQARTTACTYQGVTIVLTPGSNTVLVDGKAVEIQEAPIIRDGSLISSIDVFEEWWKFDIFAALDENRDGRVCWIVTP